MKPHLLGESFGKARRDVRQGESTAGAIERCVWRNDPSVADGAKRRCAVC